MAAINNHMKHIRQIAKKIAAVASHNHDGDWKRKE